MAVVVKSGSERASSERKDEGVEFGEAERIELEGRKEYFGLRKGWSAWIVFWITSLIIFNMVITMLVGARMLDFTKYQWFISTVTVETFLQIVGMGYIAVKFLFSENKS